MFRLFYFLLYFIFHFKRCSVTQLLSPTLVIELIDFAWCRVFKAICIHCSVACGTQITGVHVRGMKIHECRYFYKPVNSDVGIMKRHKPTYAITHHEALWEIRTMR